MTMQRFLWRSLPLAAMALVSVAPIVVAQRGQEVFEWSGRVDREVQITMRGNRLSTRDLSDSETGRGRSRVMMQLPRRDGQLYVQVLNGRGPVDVIQQPSAQNGYTATVRIQDPSSGADNYRIAAYWQTYGNDDVYRGNNGRGNDRGNNGRGNDRDDRDRDDGYHNRTGSANPYGGTGRDANQTMLHWSGNVDGELEIRVSNGQVSYRTLSGDQPTSIRADRGAAASQRGVRSVALFQNQGRGTVTLTQQPSAYNGYTTVIRVRDPQGGYGFYDFDLMLQ
ncbi:MAG: hypothetical protein ABI205_12465 [Gemmatimonadaceae bacterium]